MPVEYIEELALEIIHGGDPLVRLVVSNHRATGVAAGAAQQVWSGRNDAFWVRTDAVSRAAALPPAQDETAAQAEALKQKSLADAWASLVRDGQTVHLLRVCRGRFDDVLSGIDWRTRRPWIVSLAGGSLSSHEAMRDAGYGFAGAWGAEWIYVGLEHPALAAQLAEIISSRRSAGQDDREVLRAQLSQARRDESDTRRHANARIRELQAQLGPVAAAPAPVVDGPIPAGSLAWRVALGLQSAGSRVPLPARRLATRALRAAWWIVTPHRYAERLRYLRARGERPAPVLPAPVVQDEPVETSPTPYATWIAQVEARSREVWNVPGSAPWVTFLLRAGGANLDALGRTTESVRAQSQKHWELIVCDAEVGIRHADQELRRLVQSDSRIRIEEAGPAALQRAALGARGAFLAILDAGDVVAPHAVNELACVLARHPGTQVAYSDEDALEVDGSRTEPMFKPGWSPDLLYAFNYFGRLSFLRRELVEQAGGIQPEAGAALEWDLNLRCSDLTQEIVRIPKVLCHRPRGVASERPAADSSEAADHRSALQRHWRRHGFDATVSTRPDGTQQAVWASATQPLVSVVIPTKDKVHLLRTTVQGLLQGTDYANLEVVVVDTGSTEAATLAYYEELAPRPEVRIVHFEKRFNYSAACNYGASCARGDLLLFLNNDIEVVDRGWLAEMVRYAQRPGVGVVGTRLDYPTGELQHGGVGVGPHLCALMYRNAEPGEWGILGSADHPRNWLAIMGACQLVRRDLFERVNGFDESYLVAMSDVALCLQIWKLGHRTAYAPQARLIHHEGATRGKSNPGDDIRRIADDIRLLGIDEDPYLHPEIDGHEAIPALRGIGRANPRETLAWNVETFGSLEAPVLHLDLRSDHECLVVAGRPREEVLWLPQEARLVLDKWSATRWCLDLLRRRTDVRAAHPAALTKDGQAGFIHWLRESGASEEGLPPAGLAAVEALLAGEDLAVRARQAFMNAELREELPDGLLPTAGRAQLFRWFMRTGRTDVGLRLEEVWWLLWQASEQPALELMNAWHFTPAWQRLYPDAPTVFGAPAFAAWFKAAYRCSDPWTDWTQWSLQAPASIQIRQAYNARQHWRERFPRALQDTQQAANLIHWLRSEDAGLPAAARRWCEGLEVQSVSHELAGVGINVLGHFCYPSGLRVSVEALVGGMQLAGIQMSLRDIRTDPMDEPLHAAFDGSEVFDVSLIHSQPEPFFDIVYDRADLAERRPATYKIAYWYWEFDSIPNSWVRLADEVDEVWTATEFVAKGLRERLSVPVRTLFPGVRLNGYTRRSREHFGLKPERFTFLFTFHMMSIMERKNPLALIRAFEAAFRPEEPVSLVLKTSFGARHPAQLEELRSAAEGHNIEIIDAIYSPDEVLSLMDSCDAYVSLHRSEGLGLTLAEAMLMGKPVIATGYSGNVDFMDESNSLLVPYTLKKLGRPIPPYDADSEWAEPSIEEAAKAMRRVFDDQAWASELGRRAQASALERLSLETAGRKVARRLEEIRSELAAPKG
ncbi:glycosyltransferase [Variovorax soli]|uniref:glycosyltransferase n=1 Tax=Variovorax soli TaxID=376815 RepID=UPI000A051E53|nr:glycosyltransferase [Variovorax soli]